MAPGSPPDDPVRGLAPCFIPLRLLQSGGSFCRTPSAASDTPVRGAGFTPDDPVRGPAPCFIPPRLLHSGGSFCHILSPASDAPVRWQWVHPRTIQSGTLRRASFLRGCFNPGGLFVVLSLPPRTLQSVAPGSPPDDPVRGLMLCFIPPRLLQYGASFCRILPVASDAPVRGTGFTPGRSSLGARAVLPLAPDAPIRGVVFLSLLDDFAVCVRGALVFFFFRAPIVVATPPLFPLRFAFPVPSPPSPPPVLSSPAPFLSLCGGFAGACTQAPSVHARMLLCFGAGTHVHSSSLFPACFLFSCIVPPFVPSSLTLTLLAWETPEVGPLPVPDPNRVGDPRG